MARIVKPKYIDPVVFGGGQQLTYRPPLLFREVTARVFPLKANIARLAEFCDQYLNMDIPDEIVHFTPALPYVYFMVLNYGGMSATTVHAQRLGWVSQHEAFFLVPLERWRRRHGKLEFEGWTGVTPFIFVDDPLSMTTGREVYGWPKAQAWIEANRPVWTTHPRAPTRLFTMAVDVFHDVYAGEREPPRKLVTIDRDVAASYAEYPLNYKCPWSITSVLPNLYATSLSLMEEAADIAAHLRLRGFPDFRTSGSLMEMARQGLGLYEDMLDGLSPIPLPRFGSPPSEATARARLDEDLPRFFNSTINLKQFRDPENSELACYTALVDSAMGVDRVNQIGLLGDWDLLRGDKSGGYSISVSRYRAQPILETLGIELPNLYEKVREGEVVTLRPSFPFWMDIDLYYGRGDVICSRTPLLCDGQWIEEEEEASGAQVRRRQGYFMDRTPRLGANQNAYNTALGAATLPIIGPMHFPDLTLQVYPLLADREILKQFVDWCWNRLFGAEPKLELELVGSYVYLTVEIVGSAKGTMWSGGENIGQWKEREVSFAIPVRWKLNGELVGLAMIEPLVFADKPRAVATDREVIGRNTFKALIESPPDVWTSPGGPDAPRRLTRVATESFVELGYGLETKSLTLLEIDERAPLPESDVAGWRAIGDRWGRRIVEELQRKAKAWREQAGAIVATQALTLECLARGAPINRLSLKQYRDAAEFDRACYQAVVHSQRRIERVHAIREIERPPHIALHRLENYPIVQTLGLRVKHTRSGSSVVDYLEPVRPFWLRASVSEDLGRVVATVNPIFEPDPVEDPPRHWEFSDPERRPANATRAPPVAAQPSYFKGGGATAVGARLVEALREGDRRDLPGRLQSLSRRMLAKELQALRRAASAAEASWPRDLARAARDPAAFAAYLNAEPLERLRACADAMRSTMPAAWRAPEDRCSRVTELERLGGLVLGIEKKGGREALERIADEAMRKRCEKLMQIFASPVRETDADLRGADARSLYETYIALAAPSHRAEPPQSLSGPAAARSDLIDLVKRVERWIVEPPGYSGNWRDLVPEPAEQALDRLRLKRFVAEYDFDEERLALLAASFDEGAGKTLRALAQMMDKGPFHEALRRHDARGLDPVAALALVAEAFAGDVEDWADPKRWLRMTRGEAAQDIEALPDLQFVFEAILDDRWEGEGAPRRGPRARIPAASLGPLAGSAEAWAERHGLRRATGEDPPEFILDADGP